MLVGEIIQRIQSLYSKGVHSDDTRLSERHIYNKMLSIRSRLLFQKANKKQKISQWNYQTLPCVELIKAPLAECPCLPPVGCTILRTKHPLPEPIVNLTNHMLQSVSSLDGQIIFSEITWNEYKYKASNKYTAQKPDYFIRNHYLYITTIKGIKAITVTGLFKDPLVASKFESLCDPKVDNNCLSNFDQEFAFDDELIDVLIELSVQELVLIFMRIGGDRTNNAQDDREREQDASEER